MSQLASGTTSGLRRKARTNSNVVCTVRISAIADTRFTLIADTVSR